MPASIAILAPSAVPFQVGGSEKFWWGLRNALGAWSGALTELIKIPCREESYADLIASYEFFSEFRLDHFDMLITTKYPAWMTPHPNHVCYMQHTLRGLYDTYPQTGLPLRLDNPPAPLRDLIRLIRKPDPVRDDLEAVFEMCKAAPKIKSLPSALFAFPGPLIREIVHFFDRVALAKGQIKAWLAISGTVAKREDYLPQGVKARILPHPSDLESFHCAKGSYFFTASRLNASKRIKLLLAAMALLPCDIPLKIAGDGPEFARLKAAASSDRRIQFLGHVSDSDLPELYAGAIAVPFVPYDEDYGLITIEAMKSGKPVITTRDSGGVCEFVKDGETGLIVEPTAPELAKAMQALASQPDLAARFGENARKSVEHVSWRNVVENLLDHASHSEETRKRVVVLAPFKAEEHGSGGSRRLFHICSQLASEFEVCLVCYGAQSQPAICEKEIAPHFREIALPWTAEALIEARELSDKTGESADDIALMNVASADKELNAVLCESGKDAACVILCHPWLFAAAKAALPAKPLIYDAANVEADLKRAIFGSSPIVDAVEKTEGALCRASELIFACSNSDLERLTKLYALDPAKMALLANGCDRLQVPPRADIRARLPYASARLALFIGSGHKPNQEAVLAIFAMAKAAPEVEFLIAGSVSTQKAIREAKRPANAHLLGIVSENVKNILLSAADIGINPMLSGSGVNLKALEYISFGLPCISTPLGMRGIEGNLEPAATVCPLSEFPEKIRATLANPPSLEQIRLIAEDFSHKNGWRVTLAELGDRINALRFNNEVAD